MRVDGVLLTEKERNVLRSDQSLEQGVRGIHCSERLCRPGDV